MSNLMEIELKMDPTFYYCDSIFKNNNCKKSSASVLFRNETIL